MHSYLTDLKTEEDLKGMVINRWHFKPTELPLSVYQKGIQKAEIIAEHAGFQIWYYEVKNGKNVQDPEKFLKEIEKEIIQQIPKGERNEHLYVFSCAQGKYWHFVEVESGLSRLSLRRFDISPDNREKLRTASEQLDLLTLSSKDASLQKVKAKCERAFDVEMVTDKFYKEYKEVFSSLRDSILADNQRRKRGKKEVELYVYQLLNRMMFLYFVQKRGVFSGDKNFMATFWNAYRDNYERENNFHEQWLNVLFFEALCKPSCQYKDKRCFTLGSHPDFNEILKNAPYLNGGLFNRNESDELGITLNDKQFQKVYEFFESYNFTVQEHTAYDQDIDIDPEMLGNMYEMMVSELEQEDEQHSSGIFYTPKLEIELMLRRSIVEYLSKKTALAKDMLYEFVFREQGEQKTPVFNEKDRNKILQELNDIKIVDPACGSGHYLVEAVRVLYELKSQFGTRSNKFREMTDIIAHSIFGVDVKEWAVQIAKLRLWLELFVDAPLERLKNTKEPLLPTLSFKVRCGDSLVEEVGNTQIGIRAANLKIPELKKKIRELIHQEYSFFRNKSKKGEKEIEKREEEIFKIALRENIPVNDISFKSFYWEKCFPDVFLKKNGFDIVIANPPYVRQEKISDPALGKVSVEEKRRYKEKLFRQACRDWQDPNGELIKVNKKADYYVYFYLEGLQLLNSDGVFCYISSNSWLDVGFGAALQEILLKRVPGIVIYDNQAKRSFKHADVNTIITICGAPKDSDWANEVKNGTVTFVEFKKPFEDVFYTEVFTGLEHIKQWQENEKYRVRTLNQYQLYQEGLDEKRHQVYVGNKWGGKYLRAPEIYFKILEKGRDKLVRLGDIAEVRRGFTTGANEFFYLDKETIEKWGIEEEFLRPVIKSPRECKSIIVKPEDLKYKVFMCHKSKKELKGTNALKYIEWGEMQRYHKRPTYASRNRWWDLGERNPAGINFNYLIDEVARSYVGKIFVSDNFQAIHTDKKIEIFLNSFVSYLFQMNIGRASFGGGLIKIQTYELKDLLVMEVDDLSNRYMKDNASKSIFEECGINPKLDVAIEDQEPKPLLYRAELDKIVFDALGLTENERKEVYRAVCRLVWNRISKAKSMKKK